MSYDLKLKLALEQDEPRKARRPRRGLTYVEIYNRLDDERQDAEREQERDSWT